MLVAVLVAVRGAGPRSQGWRLGPERTFVRNLPDRPYERPYERSYGGMTVSRTNVRTGGEQANPLATGRFGP